MSTYHPESKWTAFLMSLAVPGSGQVWLGSWTAVGWWVAVGLLVAAGKALAVLSGWPEAAWLATPGLLALSVASAEHAKRLADVPPVVAGVKLPVIVQCEVTGKRQVKLGLSVEIPLPAAEVWSWVSDLPRFLVIDPFHCHVWHDDTSPNLGTVLHLEHCAFGIRFLRRGRLLKWSPPTAYTFSDLSQRGPRAGFPHVFALHLLPGMHESDATRLTFQVTGLWTSRLILRGLGLWWLRYVMYDHARLLRCHMQFLLAARD